MGRAVGRQRRLLITGWLCGSSAAFIWAVFQVLSKHGLSSGGFEPLDLTLFRFGIPGLILLPVALTRGRREMRRLGALRVALLTLASGPALGMSTMVGYSLAPLSHGAVLFPAFTTLFGVLLSRIILGTQHTLEQRCGLVLTVFGLLVVGGGAYGGTQRELCGDAFFALSGLLWGSYTVLLKLWKVDGLCGAAIVGVWSSLLIVGLYVAFGDIGHLLAAPRSAFWIQAVFQGVFAGVLAVITYGYAVQYLGAAMAALFPATIPLLALTLGALTIGAEIHTAQWLGLLITTLGLLFAVGFLRIRLASALSSRN